MSLIKTNIDRIYEGTTLKELVCTLNMLPTDNNEATESDALYYLICALDKCNGKHHTKLDFIEKMQVLSRLDAAMEKLNKLKNEIEYTLHHK